MGSPPALVTALGWFCQKISTDPPEPATRKSSWLPSPGVGEHLPMLEARFLVLSQDTSMPSEQELHSDFLKLLMSMENTDRRMLTLPPQILQAGIFQIKEQDAVN